jgi:hypothetical protein
VLRPAIDLVGGVGVLLVIAALVRASVSRVTWTLFRWRLSRVAAVLLGMLVVWALGSRR